MCNRQARLQLRFVIPHSPVIHTEQFFAEDEKHLVEEVFNNAIDLLSDEDKKLPQINTVLPLLKKGVGIHHSGLLPIIKETIEILFGEGLIKALFATETFSMGLNMPARTVLFTAARKFDGKELRWVNETNVYRWSTWSHYSRSHPVNTFKWVVELDVVAKMNAGLWFWSLMNEWTRLRRKKSSRSAFLLDDHRHPLSTRFSLSIQGKADPLNSAFKLTYNMVLNLLRVEGINPEFMLERSFYQFQHFSSIPALYDSTCLCCCSSLIECTSPLSLSVSI